MAYTATAHTVAKKRRGLLDGSRQLLHLRIRLLDRALLLHRRVVAELLVGRN